MCVGVLVTTTTELTMVSMAGNNAMGYIGDGTSGYQTISHTTHTHLPSYTLIILEMVANNMLCQLEGVVRQKLNIFVKKLTLYINRIVIQIQIQYKIINTHSFKMKNRYFPFSYATY